MDLFLISRADIFAIYPKILKEILQAEERARSQDGLRLKDLVRLPSDADFQDKVYYRLLAVQKNINEMVESGASLEEIAAKKDKHLWDPEVFSFSNKSSPLPDCLVIRRRCVLDDPLCFLNSEFLNNWKLDDLIKAAKLLRKPVIKCSFANEHEMRRVYAMIYDVFRYKHVISQALEDVSFYKDYPDLRSTASRIWLLVYDMHLRNFGKREPKDQARAPSLYEEADIKIINDRICKHKINLAASLSRLRIQSGALKLSDLLPTHLQDDKVAVSAAVALVTGWINPFKLLTKADANDCLRANGFLEAEDTEEGETLLKPKHFKWDKVCPLFMSCVPEDRGLFSGTDLVRNDKFIMQDRAFSYGPAVFSHLLGYFDIEGDVVQTQVSSPRSTAYLAALVLNNPRVHAFLAFGAGSRLAEYHDYFATLGCTSVRVFAENFCDFSVDSNLFEKVVGIFVTPPNSYSGVTDPIDLICSRGGDLTMLEVLTESEMSDNSKLRVAQILEQQRESLRLSMSRPQVQFVLYETHSVVESENELMVQRTIDYVNSSAHSKHIRMYKEKRRLEMLAEIEGVSVEQLEKLQGGGSTAAKKKLKEREEAERRELHVDAGSSSDGSDESENEALETSRSKMSKRSNGGGGASNNGEYNHIKIPKTDLFETIQVPDICTYQDNCMGNRDTGCFLSLIKRKHVTRLDEKYLIVMAERRGLFGDTNPKKVKVKPATKHARAEKEKIKARPKVRRAKSEDISELINRLLTPTYASSRRCDRRQKSSTENAVVLLSTNVCQRICFHKDLFWPGGHTREPSIYRLWWKKTIDHLHTARRRVGHHPTTDKEPPTEVKSLPDDLHKTNKSTVLSFSLPRRQKHFGDNRNKYPIYTRNIVFDQIAFQQ